MSTMLSSQGVLIEQGSDTKQMADCFALRETIGIDTYGLRKFIIGKYPNVHMEVLGPVPYARAVKKIGNEMDLALVDLKEVLSLADIGYVSWKGIGKPLLEEILEVASKLVVGTAGGLSALANIPADDFSLTRGDPTDKTGRCIRDEIIRVSEQWQKKSYLSAKQGSELDPLPIFKPKEGKIGEIAEAKLYGMEPCCDGKLVFDAGRVTALLVLGISAPLSNEKHTFSIPPRIFHYAVELLGRISHALSDVMDQDTLLAYLYHCSGSRVMSSGEFDFKRKESFLPVEDGSTNNAIYEKSCSADMQAIKWGKQGR
ncbi:hypothetical protein RHGRI_015584 [Rhododendron griersonianum]|uniref:Uncharacterized protein n=1 Tax=Rhododendron griersonianum TaxID=479676 RepID=A0AAV6KDV8_9ERIC|nr:hypothetical protein RHGRI_015584 [Rhododendron griersonianum]